MIIQNNKPRRKRARKKSMGKTVNVRIEDGTIKKIAWKDILHNEEGIIEENMIYGCLHGGDYTQTDVLQYEQQARADLEALKKTVMENPDIVLTVQPHTQRYIPETQASL